MVEDTGARSLLPPEATRHYAAGAEAERLAAGRGRVELARTQELILRYLPAPPAVIYDVGGGPGVYASWLAGLGYGVHRVDALPLHVEQARAASAAAGPHARIGSVRVGDARQLEFPDGYGAAVLLLGPLYHLTERADRLAALREAGRVLRPGGVVLAAAISRFASWFDGLLQGMLDDPAGVQIIRDDLQTGQHRNPIDNPRYFTTTYFHHPSELAAEIADAGLRHEATLAIEGPAALLPDLDATWADAARREQLLEAIRWIEAEPSLLGMSSHVLAVGRKG
ncbi:MAG TPA: class I SAM-dependent methyltransferase [Chloroflexia bacterium]|nr:class I SAM-dependent methyltransferase [Chloroflexia bacterium]